VPKECHPVLLRIVFIPFHVPTDPPTKAPIIGMKIIKAIKNIFFELGPALMVVAIMVLSTIP
jgi:hypothetical protein